MMSIMTMIFDSFVGGDGTILVRTHDEVLMFLQMFTKNDIFSLFFLSFIRSCLIIWCERKGNTCDNNVIFIIYYICVFREGVKQPKLHHLLEIVHLFFFFPFLTFGCVG